MDANRRKALIFSLLGITMVAVVLLLLIVAANPSLHDAEEHATAVVQLFPTLAPGGTLPLRDYAEQCGLTIGTAVDVDALRDEPLYRTTLAREFNSVTPENAMKFRNLSRAPNQYDFSDADTMVDFALANDMQIRGHTLVWHQALPDWLTSGNFSKDDIQTILIRHIHTLVGRYQDKIAIWDVVNEAVNYDGHLRDSLWLEALGKNYIEMAFRAAHEADPQAKLFYSDYDGEALNTKSNAIYTLMKELLERDTPIDGVAFHLHIRLDDIPNWDDVQSNIQRLQALGLEVQMSEVDVRTQDVNLLVAEKIVQQADVYGAAAHVCLGTTACTSFSTWGFTDLHTWINGLTGTPDLPLLFDADYQPKPAYQAVSDALRTCCISDGNTRCNN